MKNLFLLLGFAVFVVGTVQSVSAQLQPPLSPWLNLFNNSRGNVLDNYHTYVAPQIQAQQDFATQQSQQKDLQRQIDKALNAPKKRPSYAPGNGAGYRQYLHYYSGLSQGGPPYHGKR
jgi:hypothetical protein